MDKTTKKTMATSNKDLTSRSLLHFESVGELEAVIFADFQIFINISSKNESGII